MIKEVKTENNLVDLEVPDLVAGAVLGPKAKTLVDIQKRSGCKVEVHKRESNLATEGFRRIRSLLVCLISLLDSLVVNSVFATFRIASFFNHSF